MSAFAPLLRIDPLDVIEGAAEDEASLNLRREVFVQALAVDPTVPEWVSRKAQWLVEKQLEIERRASAACDAVEAMTKGRA